MLKSFHSTFPFPKERKTQTQVLDILEKNWDKKKFFLLQLPTGVGKSGIAIAVTQALEDKTIISTPQKLLQRQYMSDFGSNLNINIAEIKGRNNYQCVNEDCSCAEGPGAIKASFCPKCPYMEQKKAAESAQTAVMNFAYYMAMAFGTSFKDHPTLVVDEAHNLAEQIVSFAEIRITDSMLGKIFDSETIKVPELNSLAKYEKWLRDLMDTINLKIDKIEKIFEAFDIDAKNTDHSNIAIKEMKKDYDRLVNFAGKIQRYMSSKERIEWVWSFEETWTSRGKGKKRPENCFSMKPLDIGPFAEQLMFSRHEKIVLMSATLLDKRQYCASLGIKEEDALWIDAPSDFPASNHSFLCHGVGKLNAKEIDETLPKLIPVVEKILEAHKGEKGIIHCNSFKITNYIRNNISNPRLLIQEQGQQNQEIYDQHKSSTTDTVIVSPSMAEGIDLPGDQGKFQIIMKLPFAYLGDKWTKTKADRDPDWYLYRMCLSFIQAMGRIQRNETDECATYCLDPSFNYFIKVKCKTWIPRHIEKIIKAY